MIELRETDVRIIIKTRTGSLGVQAEACGFSEYKWIDHSDEWDKDEFETTLEKLKRQALAALDQKLNRMLLSLKKLERDL